MANSTLESKQLVVSPDPWANVLPKSVVSSGPPRWLLSFVDLTGVLVAFFVLMFSMKAPDMGRWEKLQNAMHKAFVPTPTVFAAQETPSGRMNATASQYRKSDGALYLQQLMQRRLQTDPLWSLMQGSVEGDGFNLPIPPALITDKGTGDSLTPAGVAAIARLAEVVRNWSNPMYVTVSGSGEQRWESIGSAMAVLEGLHTAGVNTVTGIQFSGTDATGPILSLRVKQHD
jgi:hypothetical protein